jgi:hypothetical protein
VRRVDVHLDAETEEERRVFRSLSFRGKWRKGTKNHWVKGDTTMLIQQRKTSLHEVLFNFFSSPIMFSIFLCVFFFALLVAA